jgi:hypothetical protein
MGLLKRKKGTREYRTKSGRLAGRGYQYYYQLTTQGWKYAMYLADNYNVPRPERQGRRIRKYLQTEQELMPLLAKNSPPSAVQIAQIQKSILPREGIYRRFPVPFDEETHTKYLAEQLAHRKSRLN